MELSFKDILAIEINNPNHLTRTDFCEIKNDYYILKNDNGHCIFLNPENNQCIIYDNRPQGCRYYPMLFDPHKNKCELDSECPHYQLFYNYKAEFQSTCKKLRKWYLSDLLPSQVTEK
jgi:Fe-S-cluster containining protein